MTENKRFYVKASTTDIGTVYGVKDKVKDDIVICNIGEYNSLVISELLNNLNEENERLKKELQGIYDLATVNKLYDIIYTVYDDFLHETTDESDYARKKVNECLQKIEDFRDDLE